MVGCSVLVRRSVAGYTIWGMRRWQRRIHRFPSTDTVTCGRVENKCSVHLPSRLLPQCVLTLGYASGRPRGEESRIEDHFLSLYPAPEGDRSTTKEARGCITLYPATPVHCLRQWLVRSHPSGDLPESMTIGWFPHWVILLRVRYGRSP